MFHNDKKTDVTLFSLTKSDKSDPILDIPKTPFNSDKYQINLKKGLCQTTDYKTHVDLDRLHAPDNKPGSGFGVAKFREIVQTTMGLNSPGKIKTDASTTYGSPHLFYLYMGMAPDTYPVRYLSTKYGIRGSGLYDKLVKLSEYKEWNTDLISKEFEEFDLTDLKSILRREKGVTDKSKDISLDEIVASKDILLKLKDKMLDYISEVFIPKLLTILLKDPKNKYPDTKELGALKFHLTEQGFKRWKYVIENKLEFVPFRHFEHLDLNPDQKELLKQVFDKRADSTYRR